MMPVTLCTTHNQRPQKIRFLLIFVKFNFQFCWYNICVARQLLTSSTHLFCILVIFRVRFKFDTGVYSVILPNSFLGPDLSCNQNVMSILRSINACKYTFVIFSLFFVALNNFIIILDNTNIIFDHTFIILCYTNIICDYTFFTFSCPLFFSHIW